MGRSLRVGGLWAEGEIVHGQKGELGRQCMGRRVSWGDSAWAEG